MAASNLVLTPTATMIAGATFTQAVNVKENNRQAFIDIPKAKKGKGFENICRFMESHPLQGAFFNSVPTLYPIMLNEWWYTCRSNDDNTALTGTYNSGKSTLTITEDIIRLALDLPTAAEAGGSFVDPLSKQAAREEAFPLIGQPKTDGIIKYKMFTGKWQFLFSRVVRCLGGKSSSQDQMNVFETHLFHSMVTGRNISYSRLYFLEIVQLINEKVRLFNVPFTRVLSLCFQKVLGNKTYANLEQIFYEIPVPQEGVKIFNVVLHNTEVGITPAMQRWIDHPFVDLQVSGSDHSDSEEHVDVDIDHRENKGRDGSDTLMEEASSLPHGSSGMHHSDSQGMTENIPSQSDQPSPSQIEVQVHSKTIPMDSPIHMENIHISCPTSNKAHMDTLIHEVDGQEPPSSAAVHNTFTLLEPEVIVTAKSTQNQLSVGSLDKLITAATLTHVVSIEEEVPILDFTAPSVVNTPLIPIQRALSSSSVLVHTNKPTNPLHNLAQVANVLLSKQSEIQTSHSVSSDLFPSQQGRCEETPPIPLPFIPQTSQSEVSMAVPSILKAIQDMSAKFDVKFSEMQAELQELKRITPKQEVQEVKDLVSELIAEVKGLRKERMVEVERFEAQVSNVQERLGKVEDNLVHVQGFEAKLTLLCDDVKKGEKGVKEVIDATTQGELKRKGDIIVGESSTKKIKLNLKTGLPTIDEEDEDAEVNDGEDDLDLDDGMNLDRYGDHDYSDKDGDSSVIQRIIKAIEDDKTTQTENKSESEIEESKSENKEGVSEDIEVIVQAIQDTQTDTREVRLGSSNRITEESIIAELMKYEGKGKGLAMSRKEMKKIAKERFESMKSDAVDEELLKSMAFESGMTVEAYKALISQSESEFSKSKASTSGTKTLYDSCDISSIKDSSTLAAEELEMEMVREEEEEKEKTLQKAQSEKIQREEERIERIQVCFQMKAWESKIINVECSEEKDDVMISCLLQNRRKTTIPLSKLYKVGFEEWKYIARWSFRIMDERLKKLVKTEAVFMVNAAYQLGFISTKKYKEFCTANNCTLGSRSLGLDSTHEGINLHPVPKDVEFVEGMYVKTEEYEGLCYKDLIGEECFQDIKTVTSTSLCHCLALLRECKDAQSLPFRKRLISWLFNNLLHIKKIEGTKGKVVNILSEYQAMFNKSDQEMKKLIKWKIDRLSWLKKKT